MLVFSVTDRLSFKSVRDYLALVTACQRERSATSEDVQQPVVVLVGNKIDLRERRTVSYEEAARLAEQFDFPYFETSAADDLNSVYTSFQAATRLARARRCESRTFLKRTSGSLFDLHRISFRERLFSRMVHVAVWFLNRDIYQKHNTSPDSISSVQKKSTLQNIDQNMIILFYFSLIKFITRSTNLLYCWKIFVLEENMLYWKCKQCHQDNNNRYPTFERSIERQISVCRGFIIIIIFFSSNSRNHIEKC